MTNSADPDQLASGEANWSGSTVCKDRACPRQARQGKMTLHLHMHISFLKKNHQENHGKQSNCNGSNTFGTIEIRFRHRDNARVTIKCSVQWSAVQPWDEFRPQRNSNPKPGDPKWGALTTRPPGLFWTAYIISVLLLGKGKNLIQQTREN